MFGLGAPKISVLGQMFNVWGSPGAVWGKHSADYQIYVFESKNKENFADKTTDTPPLFAWPGIPKFDGTLPKLMSAKSN